MQMKECCVGAGSVVSEKTNLSGVSIGGNVTINEKVVINNTVIMDNVHIASGVNVKVETITLHYQKGSRFIKSYQTD